MRKQGTGAQGCQRGINNGIVSPCSLFNPALCTPSPHRSVSAAMWGDIAWWAKRTLLNMSYKMDRLTKALLGKKYFYCFRSLSSTILGHLIFWHLLTNHKSYFKRVRNSMGILALLLDILICLQRTFCLWNMHGMGSSSKSEGNFYVCVDFSVITQH